MNNARSITLLTLFATASLFASCEKDEIDAIRPTGGDEVTPQEQVDGGHVATSFVVDDTQIHNDGSQYVTAYDLTPDLDGTITIDLQEAYYLVAPAIYGDGVEQHELERANARQVSGVHPGSTDPSIGSDNGFTARAQASGIQAIAEIQAYRDNYVDTYDRSQPTKGGTFNGDGIVVTRKLEAQGARRVPPATLTKPSTVIVLQNAGVRTLQGRQVVSGTVNGHTLEISLAVN